MDAHSANADNPTLVFTAPREVVIEARPRPTPGPDELLIETHCTLVSTGTELTILNGEFPPDSAWAQYARYPFVPGYDNVGEVVDVGPDVSQDWVGQTVATPSAHARYVKAPARSALPVHQDIPDEQAAFFSIAEIVMNGVRRAGVRFGEVVAIYGLGLLGQLTVRFCRLCGARPVVAIDVAEDRLTRLPQGGAIVPVNAGQDDVAAAVREATHQRMADVVFEVTGKPELIPTELQILRRQGRFVVLSSPRGETRFDFHDLCNWPSFTIIGAHCSSHPQHETGDNPWTMLRHGELFLDLVASGDMDVGTLVSHRARYTDAPRLYQMLLQDRAQAMGVVLDWSR